MQWGTGGREPRTKVDGKSSRDGKREGGIPKVWGAGRNKNYFAIFRNILQREKHKYGRGGNRESNVREARRSG